MWEDWEDIVDNITDRLKVPGGWIVRTILPGFGGVAQTFVSDPRHRWKLEPLEPEEK